MSDATQTTGLREAAERLLAAFDPLRTCPGCHQYERHAPDCPAEAIRAALAAKPLRPGTPAELPTPRLYLNRAGDQIEWLAMAEDECYRRIKNGWRRIMSAESDIVEAGFALAACLEPRNP